MDVVRVGSDLVWKIEENELNLKIGWEMRCSEYHLKRTSFLDTGSLNDALSSFRFSDIISPFCLLPLTPPSALQTKPPLSSLEMGGGGLPNSSRVTNALVLPTKNRKRFARNQRIFPPSSLTQQSSSHSETFLDLYFYTGFPWKSSLIGDLGSRSFFARLYCPSSFLRPPPFFFSARHKLD